MRTASRMLAVTMRRRRRSPTISCTLSPVIAGSALIWLTMSFVHWQPAKLSRRLGRHDVRRARAPLQGRGPRRLVTGAEVGRRTAVVTVDLAGGEVARRAERERRRAVGVAGAARMRREPVEPVLHDRRRGCRRAARCSRGSRPRHPVPWWRRTRVRARSGASRLQRQRGVSRPSRRRAACPLDRIAARWSPRAVTSTSWPARSRSAAIVPPTAPAPITPIRMPPSATGSGCARGARPRTPTTVPGGHSRAAAVPDGSASAMTAASRAPRHRRARPGSPRRRSRSG